MWYNVNIRVGVFMFSFFENDYSVIENNVMFEDMQIKYADKYMIIKNGHVENKRIHGDIIAILTPEEYEVLEVPKSIAPKFAVWEGYSIMIERITNLYGIHS